MEDEDEVQQGQRGRQAIYVIMDHHVARFKNFSGRRCDIQNNKPKKCDNNVQLVVLYMHT